MDFSARHTNAAEFQWKVKKMCERKGDGHRPTLTVESIEHMN